MGYRIVSFTENSDRYYDYSDQQLHNKTSHAVIKSKYFNRYERKLLELLVDNAGKPVSRDKIIEHIKGSDPQNQPELKSVDNHILNLRRVLDHHFGKVIIEAEWGVGFRYVGKEPESKNNSDPIGETPLPHILTKTVVPFANKNTIICRERELEDTEIMLSGGETAILLSGFGGIGKTSLAQVLYSKISHIYNCVGWVEYHGTLKDSLLAAIEMYEDIPDQETRWKAISTRLKNDQSQKILFIDNVDRNAAEQQDPANDFLLREITGWANLTVVLTSRIKEIAGYNVYSVAPLGNESHPEPCVDLFYFYYDKSELKKEYEFRCEVGAVYELVALAGFHTYAIELIARSAVYEDTLSEYLEKIREIGFQFPSLEVATNYHSDSATAATQLKLLFNLHSRSKKEQKILWDFSVLPEGTALSRHEVTEFFLFTQNDLHRLCLDSWLRYRKGYGFYIHPLVREIIHFDLNNGKAPAGTIDNLINLVIIGNFISDGIAQSEVNRRLSMIEGTIKYINFGNNELEAKFYLQLGLAEYTNARKRLTSIAYLEKSLLLYQSLQSKEGSSQSLLVEIANIKYQLGYIKSTTQIYRDDAKNDLQAALDIWQSITNHEAEVAMAHDHLGYVLSDYPETYQSAEFHLKEALQMRERFLNNDRSQENLRDYATTSDNLGFLLSKSGQDFEDAKKLLISALRIREDVFSESGQHGTDVAWTAYNLGKHLSQDPEYFEDAERYFKRSLEIRRNLERAHPNTYVNNIVLTLVALAKLISHDPSRISEANTMLTEAINLKAEVDPEHTGYFSQDVESDIVEIQKLIDAGSSTTTSFP